MRILSSVFAAAMVFALPAAGATKVTVQQLDAALADMHRQAKSDDATANKLKDYLLTEQLSATAMNSFVQYEPGPLTTVQIRVLALESAMLPPPPAELPTTSAPDPAAQTAMMARAVDYAVKQFAHLPKFTATKTTTRYQNGQDFVRTGTGAGASMANSDLGLDANSPYMRMLGQHTASIVSENGIELPPAKGARQDPAGQNGQVSQAGAGPVLGLILLDAAKGKMGWLRWEAVNGKPAAVFSFSVNRKQSHYQVDYCCFPQSENVGSHIGASPSGGSLGGSPSSANYGVATSFAPFKTTPGYHGEIFVDPESGTILRLITQAEFKPSDLVQQEDVRIDYAPADIGGKPYVLPVQSMLLTTVIPNGESFQKVTTRRTLFDVKYANYQLATPRP